MTAAPREQAQIVQITEWHEDLHALHDRIAPRVHRPEVRRLLALLPRDRTQHAFRLHWSSWRRQRQAEARRSHFQSRLARSDAEVPQ